MAEKRQRKPTEKARELFSNVKKIIKRKASQELTSGKSRKHPTTVLSDTENSDSPSKDITPTSTPTSTPRVAKATTSRRAVVRTEEEEEALHSDEELIPEDESSDTELGKN
jgi:hypothetical protein